MAKNGKTRPTARICVAVPFDVFPPRGGGQQRIFHLYRHLASALDGGDTPVMPDTLALLALVLAEGDAGRANVTSVAGHDDTGVRALAAELIYHIRRLAPVGVDQTSLDPQLGTIIAPPRLGHV